MSHYMPGQKADDEQQSRVLLMSLYFSVTACFPPPAVFEKALMLTADATEIYKFMLMFED